ncbi:WXG100 family type VII secretion target [Mycobacteroides salmoniphilum]|uniref:WXG100 family type VII secretion target n=1 Tax=Mycobacteroides salmoniphilum TaxID=404941 RepID=UPI000992CBC8|nr:WXG100 family type VII secretion target [Mycobacteroides salmoniphilum]
MAERSYDLDAMQEHIDLLTKQMESLTEQAKNIERTAEGVLSQYEGQGAAKFLEASTDWRAKFTQHLESLGALRDRIKITHGNYLDARTKNREMFPGA